MRGYIGQEGQPLLRRDLRRGRPGGTGKERRRWYPRGRRKGDAERLVTELHEAQDDGEIPPVPTASHVARTLIRQVALPARKPRLRPSTFDSYSRNIDRHVIPAIGRIPLHTAHARRPRWLLQPSWVRDGAQTNNGGSLRRRSTRSMRCCTRRSPMPSVRGASSACRRPRRPPQGSPPARSRPRGGMGRRPASTVPQRHRATPRHSRRLLPSPRTRGCGGVRVLGLRRRDCRSRRPPPVCTPGACLRSPTPSTSPTSRPAQDVGPSMFDTRTISILRSWRKRQLKERLALGALHEDQGLVFTRPEGTPIHPDLFSKTVRPDDGPFGASRHSLA